MVYTGGVKNPVTLTDQVSVADWAYRERGVACNGGGFHGRRRFVLANMRQYLINTAVGAHNGTDIPITCSTARAILSRCSASSPGGNPVDNQASFKILIKFPVVHSPASKSPGRSPMKGKEAA